MAEENNQTDSSADLAKVQDFIKGQVESYFNELSSKTVQQGQQSVKTEQDQAREQLQQFITPFVEPSLNEAKFTSADAKDYVSFYTNNDDAKEYQEEVEKLFEQASKANRPLPRRDILNYIIGREYKTDPDKFTEKLTSKKKAQLERASQATDFGATNMSKERYDNTLKEFSSLPLEDMEKALDGVTF